MDTGSRMDAGAGSHPDLELLRELLRLDTSNPPGGEGPAAELLGDYLKSAGLEVDVLTSPLGRPNVVARLEGPSDEPALVLVSHTDVVPVEEDHWSHDPFGAEVADGYLYGRGALDMKSICCMHAIAAAAAASGAAGGRELIVCAVADEEAGGEQGMKWLFDEHPGRLGLDAGRPLPEALGEGGYGLRGILETPIMPIVLAEKNALWLRLSATGAPGHGSIPPADQAVAKLVAFVDDVAGYGRPHIHPVMKEQFQIFAQSSDRRAKVFKLLSSPAGGFVARATAAKLRSSGTLGAMLSDTITPTELTAGYKSNVVPGQAHASLDCRLLPDTDPEGFLADLKERAAAHDVEVESPPLGRGPASEQGPLFEHLAEVSSALTEEPLPVPSLTPGFTDLRYLRRAGATAYGWVPLVLDPDDLAGIHGHDERISVDGYHRAVAAMTEVVTHAVSSEP